ncbi:MAG: hypothetical protein AB3N11_00455 [Arenibacterium sp.]
MTRDVFSALPVWSVLLVSAVFVFIFLELGYRLAVYRSKKVVAHDTSSAGLAAGGILGLVSFVLAFAFGIAASHHETRKEIVLEQANIIGTAYLRADLLNEPERTEVANLIRNYALLRYDAAVKRYDRAHFDQALIAAEAIQTELWETVARYAIENPSPATSLMVTSVNELIDIHLVALTKGVGGRMAASIWIVLYVLVGLGTFCAGYAMSRESQRRPALTFGMIVAFTSVLGLIADLDNPRYGVLQSDERPMEKTLSGMRDDS